MHYGNSCFIPDGYRDVLLVRMAVTDVALFIRDLLDVKFCTMREHTELELLYYAQFCGEYLIEYT